RAAGRGHGRSHPSHPHPGGGRLSGGFSTGALGAVAVVGPTASGKSAVAMAVARALGDVNIVSVDAFQVYRGMDIGTAKATPADRAEVAHHGLDLADPADEVTVVDYLRAYDDARSSIAARQRRALLVGGTGLYFRAA